MRLRYFWILIVFFCSCSVSATVRFTHLFPSLNALNSGDVGVVDVVIEDTMGFIWFGAQNGLSRYDGHAFKTYKNRSSDPNSLPSNRVRAIAIDHRGVMWVGTSAGLVRYIPETDSFVRVDLSVLGAAVVVSSDVYSLAFDRFNNLIVGTQYGLVVLDGSRSVSHTFFHQPSHANSLSDSFIRSVYVDSKNRIWVGTNAGGVNHLNLLTSKITRFVHDEGQPQSLSGNDVRSIFEDTLGRIWVGTYGAGINRINLQSNTVTHYLNSTQQKNNQGLAVYNIIEDGQQNVLIATDHGGLGYFNEDANTFHFHTHDPYNNSTISSNNVRAVFEDSSGDIWVSSFPGAIDFIDQSSSSFNNYRHIPNDSTSLSNSAILTVYRGASNILWVATEEGLNQFDVNSKTFSVFNPHTTHEPGTSLGTVLSVVEDDNGYLWIGTWSGGLYKYNLKTHSMTNYLPENGDPRSISSKYIWRLFIDSSQRLWIGTENGLNRYNPQTDDFSHYLAHAKKSDAIIDNDIRDIVEAANGDLWIATLGGLDRFDPIAGIFHHYKQDINNPNTIQGVRISDLLIASDGLLWIATQDSGLNIYYPSENQFKKINTSDGLPTNNLSGLVEDAQGNIWMSSPSGLIQFEKDSLNIKHYTKDHGLAGDNFNRSAAFRDELGNLYFGSTEGLSVFHPAQLTGSLGPSPIHITEMRTVKNKLGHTVKSGQPFVRHSDVTTLLNTSEVTFGYDVQSFSIMYALLSYRSSNKNRYAYRLEGFEDNWHYSTLNEASYTNIPAGDYLFTVKAANRDGVWMPHSDTIRIKVLPAPWKSWWAYILYLSAFIVLLLYFWRGQLKKSELYREKMLNAKLIKIDRIKDAILANTSHELRSPLHSIVGISESLIDGIAGDLNGSAKDYLRIVTKNGKKLTQLVDNILDYASLVDDEEKIISRPVDVYALIKSVIDNTHSCSEIRIINQVSRSAPMILADEERLLQVFQNIIENSLTLTKQGAITFTSEEGVGTLKVDVRDSGTIMSSAQVNQLFNPFNMTEGFDYSPLSGIGLGLAISKHLVELHGGTIEVSSEEGKGNCFTVVFPIDQQHTVKNLSPSIKSLNRAHPEGLGFESSSRVHSVHGVTLDEELKLALKDFGTHTLLVVDDDSVNRMILSSMLSQYGFKILEAASGEEVIELVNSLKHNLDMIIMDVMMPGLSGYDTCKVIRQQWSIHQLPVIFLTAKRVSYSATDGFLAGGNDFTSKPVSKYELLPRIINILKTKKAMMNNIKD